VRTDWAVVAAVLVGLGMALLLTWLIIGWAS